MESLDSRNGNGRGSAPSSQLEVGVPGPELGAVRDNERPSGLPPKDQRGRPRNGRVRGEDPDVQIVRDVCDVLEEKARAKRIAPPYDPATEETCPLLWGWITRPENKKGEDRYLPEIILKRADGGWFVTLRDCDTNQQTSCFSETFQGLARAIESHFASGKVIWSEYKNRANPDGINRKRKKKD